MIGPTFQLDLVGVVLLMLAGALLWEIYNRGGLFGINI